MLIHFFIIRFIIMNAACNYHFFLVLVNNLLVLMKPEGDSARQLDGILCAFLFCKFFISK